MTSIKDDFEKNASDALETLMTRIIDAKNGFDTMVEKAEPEFERTARSFRDLHENHANRLKGLRQRAGIKSKDDASLMSKVNEAVVSTRAFFDDIDDNVMAQVRSGEQHVLNAFDQAINDVRSSELTGILAEMRAELRRLIDKTRDMG